MAKVAYKFSATLFDKFYDYLNSDDLWERYYGFAENPSILPEEFHQKQYQSLIDSINRVPFKSLDANKGTAFNEVIDCMVLHQNTKRKDMKIVRWRKENGVLLGVKVTLDGDDFFYPLDLINEVASWYKGGLPQQYIQAILPTCFGDIMVYGYIDYVMPFKTCDLKTTKKYWFGKFKHHFQHIVYPYALAANGADVREFEYNVVEWKTYGCDYYTEHYLYRPERDVPRLTEISEELVRFLQDNRDKIIDKKIFALI